MGRYLPIGTLLVVALAVAGCGSSSPPPVVNPPVNQVEAQPVDAGANADSDPAPLAEAPFAEAPPSEVAVTDPPTALPTAFPTDEPGDPFKVTSKSDFVATDPSTVNLATGSPQLVEFFAFW